MRSQADTDDHIRTLREQLRLTHRRLSNSEHECAILRDSIHKHEKWALERYEQSRSFMKVEANPDYDNMVVNIQYRFMPSLCKIYNKENFYKWIHDQMIQRLEQAVMKVEKKHLAHLV